MTTTCSNVAVVKNEFRFFMDKAPANNTIYTSMIQSVIEYEIVLCLMENLLKPFTGSIRRAIQSLEID